MIDALAQQLAFGSLLTELTSRAGGYDLIDHWQQGEFHHDVVVRIPESGQLPGPFLVVSTSCNGGVKELLCFGTVPARGALWHHRCPDNAEFAGDLPPVLASARTVHWFDPCELLKPNARSEYREDARERQPGGGWTMKADPTVKTSCGRGPAR
ncbi:MAG: uncharacterized protein JWM82_3980 [Myxococcales bacterium]|nr:uncharacterized protein [Myxococcales bacterium]